MMSLLDTSEDFGKASTSEQLRSTAAVVLVILSSCIRRVGSFEEERERALLVSKEDVYETLCKAHDKICHAGRFRMWAYLEKHKLHITRSLGIILTALPYIPGEEGEGDCEKDCPQANRRNDDHKDTPLASGINKSHKELGLD